MGALADFIRREFGSDPAAPKNKIRGPLAAIPAIPAIPRGPNSENSGNSSPPIVEINSRPVPVVSLDERRANVAHLLDRMADENERRRDWWKQPVDGWREGRLEWRSAEKGEATIIHLSNWRVRT